MGSPGTAPAAARALYERGLAATNAQRYVEGRRLLDRAAAHPGADPDLRARIAGTTAYLLAQTGEPARAEELCRAALDADDAGPHTRAVLAGQLGVLFTRAGRLDEADDMLGRAIAGLDGVELANCLLNRSLVRMQRRAFDAAAEDLERSVALYRAAGDETATAEAAHNLGYVALLRGDLVLALELMSRSRPAIAAESDLSAAMSDLDRAEVLRDAGLAEEAEQLLESVSATFGRARMRQARAEAEFHLARSLLRHDPVRAERVARTAGRRFRALRSGSWAARSDAIRLDAVLAQGRSPGPEAFRTAAEALDAAGFRSEAAAVRFGAALDEVRRRGPRDAGGTALPRLPRAAPLPLRLRAAEVRAERAAREGRRSHARRYAARGLDLLTGWQSSFGALDLQASTAVHGEQLVRQGLAAAVADGDPRTVFDWSERARHLSQRIAPVRPPHDAALAADLGELRMLRSELAGEEWTQDPRVRALRDRARERQWTATGAGDARPRAALAELRRALDADTVALAYVFTGDRLVCLVTTTAGSRLVPLPWDAVQEDLRGLRADLDVSAAVRSGPLAAVVRRALDDRLRRLDAALLAPVIAGSGPRVRALITAPGVLAGVPWGMLPAMSGRPFTLATSASRWLHERRTAPAPLLRAGFAAGPHVARAEEEVTTAAAAWDAPVVLTGAAAGVEAVTALAGGSDVLHVAAHGRHTVDNPLFSGLELADGILFGYDVDLVPRPPAVVLLSACELGRSSVRGGEEALGMTRVWLHAGTRCVVSSPVVVPDDVACELLGAVHGSLRAGLDPAAALSAAAADTGHRTPFQCHGSGF
ncbi:MULTISPECIES: CHAT domain-containing protein [unclassified Microbacterium]|uniref:CHAT domain-containing protein n=1 Tax=unclassified Microbacterium TaxID=2609290 RepID=UPI00300F9F3D